MSYCSGSLFTLEMSKDGQAEFHCAASSPAGNEIAVTDSRFLLVDTPTGNWSILKSVKTSKMLALKAWKL